MRGITIRPASKLGITALLLLPAWLELSAVPVHIRAEPVRASGALTKEVAVRLIPQSHSDVEDARNLLLSLPGEQVVDLPAGTWQVLTEAPDLWSPPEWIAPIAGQAETRITLRLFPASPASGRLTGVPNERMPAFLELRLETSLGSAPDQKLPKGSGRCPVAEGRFRCVLPAGRLDLRLQATGFIPFYLWDVDVRRGEVADLGALRLQPGASVTGWVRDTKGREAGGARVRLEPQTLGLPGERPQVEGLLAMSLETQTNRRGFFQLVDPAPGMFVVTVEKDLGRTHRTGIEVRAGLEAQILDPLVLAKPVSLRVILDPSTTPSGAPWKVALEPKAGTAGARAEVYRGQSTPEGTWEQTGLISGKYSLYFKDGETHWHAEEVELAQEQTVLHVALGGLRILGRVHLGGEPLQATLRFSAPSAARQGQFQADEEGRFEGRLSTEGAWNVEVVSEAERLQVRLDPVEIRKLPGQSHARVDIRVPDTRLRGSVVDEKGQAVPQADLLFMAPRKLPSKVATDAEGKFDVRGLPAGSLFVHAVKDEKESDWLEARVEEERETPELRLILRSRQPIQGRVYSSLGPVPGAQVSAMAPPDQTTAASADQAVTGPAGEFTVKLPAGIQAVHLSVLAPGYATRMLFVPLGVEPVLEIPLEPVGGTLIFDLGDRTLEQLRGTATGILSHGGSFVPFLEALRWAQLQRAAQLDPHRLVLPNMEAGDYLLCAGPESYLSIPRGLAPPAHQCSRGTLAPLQELILPLPESSTSTTR